MASFLSGAPALLTAGVARATAGDPMRLSSADEDTDAAGVAVPLLVAVGEETGKDWLKFRPVTVIGPTPFCSGWMLRLSSEMPTWPPTATFHHWYPTSPNPPSLNCVSRIQPVFVGLP